MLPDPIPFLLSLVYRCGSAQGWSRRFRFRALQSGPNWSPRLAVFGDMGADNPQSLPRLRRETQQGMYDVVLHVGEVWVKLDRTGRLNGEEGAGGEAGRIGT